MGKAQRDKGKVFERSVAHLFRDAGFQAERTAQYRGNTGQAGDVEGPAGIHIEAKHQEKMRLYDWMEQAVRDAEAEGKGNLPVVIHKQNYKDVLVTMRWEDWVRLYEEWEVHNAD